jgi:biopolymer transport protein ExbD
MKRSKKFGSSSHEPVEHGHNLTSLVDCFAIILVYLLLATSFGEISMDTPKDMKLPKASEAQALMSDYIVQVHNQQFIIDNKPYRVDQLAAVLKAKADSLPTEEGKSKSLVIQADRKMSYGEINPLIMVSLQAGFQELQFAVVKDDDK